MHLREIWSASLLCVSILLSGKAIAGGNSGQIGIALSVTESTPDIAVTIWGSDNLTIEPSLAISTFANKYARFRPGLAFAYHFRSNSDLRPYIGLEPQIDFYRANDTTFYDIIIRPSFGMEYFFEKHFSLAGEYGVSLIITDNRFSPSFMPPNSFGIITTGTLTARFYF